MGAHRISTRNTDHWQEKHPQDFRHHRVVLRPFPLLFPIGVQRRNLRCLSRKNRALLFPAKDILDSGQCLLLQRPRCLDVVLGQSETHIGIQSSSVLTGTQRSGENMASHTLARDTQRVFPDSRRTPLRFNLNFSKHPERSLSGFWIPPSISVIVMSLYLCNDIKQMNA